MQGSSHEFETKLDLENWIKVEGVTEHKVSGLGILPDDRIVQMFHGHTESLVTKVEIG
jgi:hypothetical protein